MGKGGATHCSWGYFMKCHPYCCTVFIWLWYKLIFLLFQFADGFLSVILYRVTLFSAGLYSCEVSADFPEYDTEIRRQHMHVFGKNKLLWRQEDLFEVMHFASQIINTNLFEGIFLSNKKHRCLKAMCLLIYCFPLSTEYFQCLPALVH